MGVLRNWAEDARVSMGRAGDNSGCFKIIFFYFINSTPTLSSLQTSTCHGNAGCSSSCTTLGSQRLLESDSPPAVAVKCLEDRDLTFLTFSPLQFSIAIHQVLSNIPWFPESPEARKLLSLSFSGLQEKMHFNLNCHPMVYTTWWLG